VSDILRMRVRLAATPATVYHALTDPEALRTWLAEHADVSVSRWRLAFWGRTTPQGQPDRQRLVAAEPERLLRFVWTLDGEPTTVDLRLQPDGDGTALTLLQDNLPTLEELMAPPGRRDGRHSMHTFWSMAVANLAAYVEGRELVPMADFSPARSPEIRIELAIDAASDDVFASLIDPARIRDWFGWEAHVQPHVGGRATLGVEGKIFEFDPPKRLAYADEQGAVVRWELADSGGRTYLTFVQSGYTDTELDNAAQHEAGWLGSLAELRRMHELGDAWEPLTTELPADDGGDGA
jgi:uncharacterized protein YndB with AHSA1/START domain